MTLLRATLPALAASTALLVSGCTAPQPKDDSAPPVNLATLDAWQASGRLAVAANGSGGSGSFNWQQEGMRSRIRIQGPVGIGGLRLFFDADTVQLEASDGRRLEAAAAWNELEARLGAPVPAQKLRYWLLGLPAPGDFRWVSEGTPAVLEQDGWRIEYEHSEQSGARLPTRLTATSGATRVRLVIDRWTLGPQSR